ncbi:MAG: PTS sugar transporter subunit IIA, partial [Spirochaetaceae bacterium]
MLINRFISPERIVLLQATKKEAALDELINTLCATTEGLDTAVISKAVWEREALFSTRIAPAIAVPHAQLPGIQTSYIVVGKSQDGVQYDAK